jgi:Phage Terminase
LAAFTIAPDANESCSPRQRAGAAEHLAIRRTPLAGMKQYRGAEPVGQARTERRSSMSRLRESASATNATVKLAEELLNNERLPVDHLRQAYVSVSDPTKTLHKLIMGRKLRHVGHPVLRWHASRVVVRRDPARNIKLEVNKRCQRILLWRS